MRIEKSLVVAALVVSLAAFPAAAQKSAGDGEFSAAAGLWLGGQVSLDDYDVTVDKDPGLLLHLSYDLFLNERLSLGFYSFLSPITIEDSDSYLMVEGGFSVKNRFKISEKGTLVKPGLCFGFRTVEIDVGEYSETMIGMALDLSVEFQFFVNNLKPLLDVGFITQPVGGVPDYTYVDWGPIFYIAGGLCF
jgi:hypothetical protein